MIERKDHRLREGRNYVNKFYRGETGWLRVCPSKSLSYKWSCIVVPQLPQSKSLPQFQWNYTNFFPTFTPPFHPVFARSEYRMEIRNFSRIIRLDVSSNCKQELQENIARRRTSVKIKSLFQIHPNPGNSSPDTRFCSFLLHGQISLSSSARSNYSWIEAFSRFLLFFFFCLKCDDSYSSRAKENFSLSLVENEKSVI